MEHFDSTIPVSTIVAGKLRRYNNLSLLTQLRRPFTIVLPNIRDMFFVGIGFLQSLIKLLVWRPDVVFTKGGYVCLPVGLAAKVLRIPLVIHDSDAHPGLTNRILARFATSIATGAPLEYYPYPTAKSHYVGIPISDEFTPLSEVDCQTAKTELGFDPVRPLVVVTGGGLGAKRINDATAEILPQLLEHTSVILISGAAQYDELRALTTQTDDRFQLHAFVSHGMARMLGAADVVVARAGATTILELAALAKPTILVPNAFLTGGHQLKNAAVYEAKKAAVVVDDGELPERPQVLLHAITALLGDPDEMKRMSKAFHAFAKPEAAKDVADLIVKAAK